MSKPVPVGARAEVSKTVGPEDTLTHRHPKLPPVLSTPNMIELMELACFQALQPYAEADEITVGTSIRVDHLAATKVGTEVRAEAVMESFDGRFYQMRVRAWQQNGDGRVAQIGRGTVGRAFVSIGKFMRRLEEKL